MCDIKTIIEEYRQGEKHAAEKIYQLFAAKMFAVCLRYSNNRSDAEDIFQDGFIKVFEQIKQYKGEGSFEGWMRRIFIHLALERIRRQKKFQFVDELDQINNLEDISSEIQPLLSLDKLNEFVKELPERYRLVFNLYIQEELSHKEIARLLEISEGTSKSNLSRARELLKKKIKEYVYEE